MSAAAVRRWLGRRTEAPRAEIGRGIAVPALGGESAGTWTDLRLLRAAGVASFTNVLLAA